MFCAIAADGRDIGCFSDLILCQAAVKELGSEGGDGHCVEVDT